MEHLGQQGLSTARGTCQQDSWRALETQAGKLHWILDWSLNKKEEEQEEEEEEEGEEEGG